MEGTTVSAALIAEEAGLQVAIESLKKENGVLEVSDTS